MDKEEKEIIYEKINQYLWDYLDDYLDSDTLENVERRLGEIIGIPLPTIVELTEEEYCTLKYMDEDRELYSCFNSDGDFMANEENNEKLEKALNKWVQRVMKKVRSEE